MIPHDLFVGEKKGKVGVTLIRHWLMKKKKKKSLLSFMPWIVMQLAELLLFC